MKSVFKIVLNKLRSTFRRSNDQYLDQQQQNKNNIQDDSEQSNKIKSSKSDSSLKSLGSSINLENHSKLSDLIENELKKKGCLSRGKHQTIIRCSSATSSPRRPAVPHPTTKYGSNKSTKSIKSLSSILSNKSARSVGQLNEERATTTSSITSSKTDLNQQRKNVSGQNSNDTISTTSSIALLFNQPQSSVNKVQFEKQKIGSNQSLLKCDSPNDSSSHLSSLDDMVPELPNLNEETQQFQQNRSVKQQKELIDDGSSYSLKDLGNESDSTVFASSPNLYAQTCFQNNNQLQQQTNQPLLISQSMSMEEPEFSDTDSLIGIEIDQTKCRSKSVDASVVIAMKNQSLAISTTGGQKKPRGSTTFLEIPKWRLFVRKPSSASTSALNVNSANLSADSTASTSNATSNTTSSNLETSSTQANNQITNITTSNIIKLADIFKDCVHCKWMDLIEPKKVYPNDSQTNSDLFSDNNNNTLNENQSLEEEDELTSDDMDSEEQDECQRSQFSSSSFFQGNDFSSTAVYHQQQSQHASSSVASSSGAKRYVKNKQRRSSYNVTYFPKPPTNLQQQSSSSTNRPLSATGFIKKSDDKQSDKVKSDKQPIFRLPSVTLSEASDDDQEKDAMNDLMNAANAFSNTGETMCISIQITEPSVSCCETELEDPGSGITVVSLEVPVLNSGKQARSASVDSSFLQVPQRTDVSVTGELPPTKSMRSRSVDIALPEGPDGPYLVVPASNQRPQTTKYVLLIMMKF